MKKRPIYDEEGSGGGDRLAGEISEKAAEKKEKKQKMDDSGGGAAVAAGLGDDLVFEVLKRADAKTLAAAACVSRRWRQMAEDERIWEVVCTRQWSNIGCGSHQLRAVVLALGGFRRLHAQYLRPLLQHPSFLSGAPSRISTAASPSWRPARWGKDEMQLSLSLLSIGYFEKMNGYKR